MNRLISIIVIAIVLSISVNSVTAQITAKSGFYNWCAPAAWVGGVPPGQTDDVIIPSGSLIRLNCNANVKSITINGTLEADNAVPLALQAEWIMVMGPNARFIWGKDGNRYLQNGTITLKGNQNTTPAHMHMGDKFFGAMNGGRIDIHGKQKHSWTKLDATASAGTTNILLQETVNWEVGDWIVIASTDFNPHEAETRQITSIAVSNNRSIIQLNTPLQYTHWGINQSFGGQTLDERAEVGLLSKNIRIEGDPNSVNTKFGGHIMVMAGSSIYMDGAQLYRMGQEGIKGRYPFHWHECRNVNGQYIKNTTIESSYNRAVTVHGTDYALIQNNIAYDHIGHGFFLEDGSEQFNTFDRNLGILSRIPTPGKEVELHDAAQRVGGRRLSPATFWIANNNNTFTNNVAAGSEATGFWYAIPENSFDPTFNIYLPTQEILNFTSNTAHSCKAIGVAFNGFFHPNGFMEDDTRSFNNPPNATLENNTVYKCAGNGFWSLPNSATYKGWKFADNGSATFHVFDQGFEDCLFVGLSNNLGTLDDPEDVVLGYNNPEPLFITNRKSQFNAFAFYDGPLTLKNCHFAEYPKPGYPAENFNILQILGAAVVSPSSNMTNISFSNVGHEQKLTFLPHLKDNTFGPNFDEGVNTTAIATLDGSFSGEIGTYTVNIIPPNTYYPYDELYFAGPGASARPDWDAWFNPPATKFGIVLTEGRVLSPEDTDMFVTRTKSNGLQETVALDRSSKSNPQQWKFMTINSDGSDYRLQMAEVPLKWERMKFAHCAHMEYVDVEYVNVPSSVSITDLPGGSTTFINPGSLAALQAQQTRSGYFLEDNTLYFRYVADQNRTTHASSYRTAESTFIDVNFNAPYYTNNDLVPIADFNGASKDKRGILASPSLVVDNISTNNPNSCNTFNLYPNPNNPANEFVDYRLNIGRQVWTGLPYLQVNFSGPLQAEVFIRDGSTFHSLGFANGGGPANLSLGGLPTKLWDVNQIWLRFYETDMPTSPTAVCLDAIHLSSGTGDLDGDGILDSKEARTCRNVGSASDLEFDFPADTSLWKLENADPDFAVPDVYRMGIQPNADGQLIREYLNFNSNECKKIVVRFVATETGPTELFYKTAGDIGYSQTKSALFQYNTKNQWVEAVFDFTNDNNWTGKIIGLRFDPPSGNTYRAVKVDYIRSDQADFVTAEHVEGPCQNMSAKFQATIGAPDGTEQYQWQVFNGSTWVNVPGGQSSIFSTLGIGDTTAYRVRVTRPSGCERYSNTVQSPPYEPTIVDSDRSICFGSNDTIQLACYPPGGTWSGPGMVGSPLFINCGSSVPVTTGNTNWQPDAYFMNGNTHGYGAIPVANTTYDAIYQTERWVAGDLYYQIPLPSGEYEIQLHFSELWNGAQNPGIRTFDVDIEGGIVESGFDIFAEVGSNTATIVRQRRMVTDGTLNIGILGSAQNPKLNAIAVLPRTFNSTGQAQGAIPMIYNYENQLTGCIESATTMVDINTNSTAIATGTQSICLGAYAQLIGMAAEPGTATYQWYIAGTNNQVSNMPFPYVNPTTTTSYELVVNVGGCLSSRSAPVTVTVNAKPTVTTQAGKSFCENDPDLELLFATPAGGKWTGIGMVGGSRYLNSGGAAITQGGFNWVADNFSASGTSYTYPANTVVNNTSSPDMYRTERHGAGGDINYQIPVPNGDYEVNLHFAELWPGAFSTGARTFSIDLEGTTVDPLVDIYDQVGGNTALIKEYYVDVQDGFLNIDLNKIVQNPKVCAVVVLARSYSPLSAGAGVHPIKYNYVDPETGCSAFKVINMTVEAAPDVTVSANQTICQGGTASFTGSTSTSGSSITYQWYFAGTNTLVANGATLSVTPNQTTSYELVVTVDGCKSFPSAPVTAIVNPPPPLPTVPADETLCQRDLRTVLNATPEGGEWTGPGILGTTLHINAGGPTVNVGGKNWVADQHFLNGTIFTSNSAINQTASEVVYQSERWAPTLNYEIPVTNNATYQVQLHFAELYPPLQAVGARVFDIEIEGNQVENDLDIYFEVGANEALIKTYTILISDGKINIDFLANVDNPKISAISILPITFWSQVAGAGTKSITYNYVDPISGCSRSNSTTYTVEAAPVATASGTTSICAGESATLTASATGSGTKIYNWYIAGTNTLVGQGQTLTVSPTQTTSYNILARVDGCLSFRSNNVTVTVNPLPATPTVPASQTLCERTVKALVATPTGGIWSGSGVTGTTFHAQAAGPGVHVLTYNYTDGNGCSSSATTTFTVDPAPVATASGSSSICAGRSVTLMGGTTTNGTTISYQWYIAGSSTIISTQQNLTVSPTVDTDYRVIVTVDGCPSFPSPIVSVTVDPANAVCFSPKVLLEGPFIGSSGVMGDNLKENNQLPTAEPYTALGFTVDNAGFTVPATVFGASGMNQDVVDWILVQLRDKTDPTLTVYSVAAFLKQDGEVITYDANQRTNVLDLPVAHDNYYLAIFHRNHLPVMTAMPIAFDGATTTLDFSDMMTPTYGTNAQQSLTGGVMGLFAGDATGNQIIDASDRSMIWNFRNQQGYLMSDITLDGTVNAADRSMDWNNRNKIGTVQK